MAIAADYLSVKEAAAALSMSPLILSAKCKRGEVPGVERLSHAYLIPADYVTGILTAREGTITQAQAADRLGVTRQYICQLVAAGKLRTRGGRVELDSLTAFEEGRAASVTAPQAAEMLGLTVPQVHYAIRRGRLDKTVGGRVTVESIERYKAGA